MTNKPQSKVNDKTVESNENYKHIDAVQEIIENDQIIKKIAFKKETLRNLVTMASHEYFDQKLKQDQMLSLVLEKIISAHYKQFIKQIQDK